MKTVDKIYIRAHATFLNLQLLFPAFRAKTEAVVWPGRSELPSDEKHQRKLWGQKTRDSSLGQAL